MIGSGSDKNVLLHLALHAFVLTFWGGYSWVWEDNSSEVWKIFRSTSVRHSTTSSCTSCSSCFVQHSDSYSVLERKKMASMFSFEKSCWMLSLNASVQLHDQLWKEVSCVDQNQDLQISSPLRSQSLTSGSRHTLAWDGRQYFTIPVKQTIILTPHRFVECDLLVLDEAVLPEVFLALFFLLWLVLGDKSLVAPSRRISDSFFWTYLNTARWFYR